VLRLEVGDVSGSVATIRQHKTAHLTGKPRMVPMTPQASRLAAELVKFAHARGRAQLLVCSSASLDALFRKVTRSLLIEDLHFHDARRTALTLLSRRVGPMDLAKISGHRDLNILLHVYYGATPQQIAQRLARPNGPRPPPPKAETSASARTSAPGSPAAESTAQPPSGASP